MKRGKDVVKETGHKRSSLSAISCHICPERFLDSILTGNFKWKSFIPKCHFDICYLGFKRLQVLKMSLPSPSCLTEIVPAYQDVFLEFLKA